MQLVGWEALLFYALAFMALFFAVFTITARNAVHSALFLISTLICSAGLFLLMQAEFVAGVQILIYVGGVLVLFLFVVMLVNIREEKLIYTRQFIMGLLIVFGLAFSMVVVLLQTQSANFFDTGMKAQLRKQAAGDQPSPVDVSLSAEGVSQNTQRVGLELYTRAALPFEIASILLLVAIIGAVRLARDKRQEQFYE